MVQRIEGFPLFDLAISVMDEELDPVLLRGVCGSSDCLDFCWKQNGSAVWPLHDHNPTSVVIRHDVDISRSHNCPQLMALYTQSRVTRCISAIGRCPTTGNAPPLVTHIRCA
ncbi:hypothetical protein ACUXG4_005765 [Cupriavidus metallidurans]|jgi:hypothetical protein